MYSQQVLNAPNFSRFDNGLPRKNLTSFFLATIIVTLGWGVYIGFGINQIVDGFNNHSYLVTAQITQIPSDRGGNAYVVTYTDMAGQPNSAPITYPSKTYTIGETVTLRSVIVAKATNSSPENDRLYENDLTAVLMHTILPTYLIILGVQIICLIASVYFARRAARRHAQIAAKS